MRVVGCCWSLRSWCCRVSGGCGRLEHALDACSWQSRSASRARGSRVSTIAYYADLPPGGTIVLVAARVVPRHRPRRCRPEPLKALGERCRAAARTDGARSRRRALHSAIRPTTMPPAGRELSRERDARVDLDPGRPGRLLRDRAPGGLGRRSRAARAPRPRARRGRGGRSSPWPRPGGPGQLPLGV